MPLRLMRFHSLTQVHSMYAFSSFLRYTYYIYLSDMFYLISSQKPLKYHVSKSVHRITNIAYSVRLIV